MKFKELFALAKAGAPVAVECKAGVHDWEGCYPEPGMRFEVTGGVLDEPDVGRMMCDFSKFDEFNKRFESSDYRDATGKGTLNARQAGYYKLQDYIYVHPDDEIATYLTILDDERKTLVEAYAAEAEPKASYVEWLEAQLLGARKQAAERVCVHVANADGINVLVALAPAGMSNDAAGDAVVAARAHEDDYDAFANALTQGGFAVFDNNVSVNVQ